MLIGATCYMMLPVRALPAIKVSTVMIATNDPGASPQFMSRAITAPLEQAMQGINGIATVRSYSSTGESHIHIKFKPGVNLYQILNKIRAAIAASRDTLPPNINPPEITDNLDGTASSVMYIGFYAKKMSPLQLSRYIALHLQNGLASIPGVEQLIYIGKKHPAVRIWLKSAFMARYAITVKDILTRLNQQNRDASGGWVEDRQQAFVLNASAKPQTIAQLGDIVLKVLPAGTQIHLTDVASIGLMQQNLRDITLVDGHPGVVLQIMPTSSANILSLAGKIRHYIASINPQLIKSGVTTVPLLDLSHYVRNSIKDIYTAIIAAILLVGCIIFLFLRSIRLTLIPVVVIPVCLLSGFAVILLLGYSINIMTMLAMVLSIGLVVDDAIVVLENIFRFRRQGLSVILAVQRGLQEIAMPIIGMTTTLIVVFLPVILIEGFLGDLIKPFAYLLAALVAISGIVSLTITPLMCSSMLIGVDAPKPFDFFLKWKKGYMTILDYFLQHRFTALIIMLVFIAVGVGCVIGLPRELVPYDDFGGINVGIQVPANSSPAYMQRQLRVIARRLEHYGDIAHFFGQTYFDDGGESFYLNLTAMQKRHIDSEKIISKLRRSFTNYIPANVYFGNYSLLNPSLNSREIDLVLTTTGTYPVLAEVANQFLKKVSMIPGVADAKNNLQYSTQVMNVNINNALAHDSHVQPSEIADTLSALYGGVDAENKFNQPSGLTPIIISLPNQLRNDLSVLSTIQVRNEKTQQLLPISEFIQVKRAAAPQALTRYNGLPATLLKIDVLPHHSMSQIINQVAHLASHMLPTNVQYSWNGLTQQYLAASHKMVLLILSAILLIYFVLAIQFKNFYSPFIILLTVPFTFLGALMTLRCVGASLNLYSELGLLTLIGLITKHGILIIDFAAIERAAGKSVQQAIVLACSKRFRPILMTTLAMVFGVLPLVLTVGEGAAGLHQIGWTLLGGMIFGTLSSLYCVPLVYTVISELLLICRE